MAASLQVEVSYKQILKIALPISLALLVPQFNFIVNNIFLGHYDRDALAVAGISGVYYLVFAGIGYGLNNGLQALISRRAGENRPQEIGKLFNQGVYISLIVAAFGIAFTYLLAPVIMKTVLRSQENYEQAIEFLYIRIWGLPFLYIYQMRNALLVGINQSKYLIAGTLAEAVANIFFDYTLIFGNLGFPALGFNGAAYASIISEFIGMFVVYLVIARKGIGKQFSLFQTRKWDPVNNLSIMRMSGPLVFQHAISIISWLIFYILIERNSTQTGLAVSNAMRNIFGFFGSFVWAFGATANSMVSNVIGQGKHDQVMGLLKKIMTVSMSIAVVVCLLLQIFTESYLSIYGQGGDFIAEAAPVLRLIAGILVLMAMSTIWLNAVTGTGSPRMTFLIEIIAIAIYLVYVFLTLEVYHLSIWWGWLSELLYWTTLFTLSFFYIRSGRWKKIVI